MDRFTEYKVDLLEHVWITFFEEQTACNIVHHEMGRSTKCRLDLVSEMLQDQFSQCATKQEILLVELIKQFRSFAF